MSTPPVCPHCEEGSSKCMCDNIIWHVKKDGVYMVGDMSMPLVVGDEVTLEFGVEALWLEPLPETYYRTVERYITKGMQ